MDHEIVAMWVQTLSGVVGVGCIVWGLFAMRAAGHRRDREIDVLGICRAGTEKFQERAGVRDSRTRRTASGSLSITCSRVAAGPLTRRVPCSHFR